jgi:RNA polymerase sigma-70 factor (ECF subfamily)
MSSPNDVVGSAPPEAPFSSEGSPEGCAAGVTSGAHSSGAHSSGAHSSGAKAMAETLVDNHRRFLAYLSRRVARPEDAEEILQEAYVRSMARGDTLREQEASTAWFYRLLHNALVDYHRRRGAEQRALNAAGAELRGSGQDTQPPLDEELFSVVCGCVRSLLTTLKPSYAEALQRVDLDGQRVQEFASDRGISANNAAVRLHRAREALRNKLLASCGTCATHGCVDCHCSAPTGCS